MSHTTPVTDFFNSAVQIAFVYPDIGTARDTPYVYWNNQAWLQVQYDAFRDNWSGEMPILYGGCEAITRYFGLNPVQQHTIRDIETTSPDKLRSLGNGHTATDAVYLKDVVHFCRWYDQTKSIEYLAERFSSGAWSLATLDKDSFEWNIETEPLSDPDLRTFYAKNTAHTDFLGGLPPDMK